MAHNKRVGRRRRPTPGRRIGIGLLVAGFVAVVGFVLFDGSSSRPAVEGRAERGAPEPNVELTDFSGERFALADYDTPVVLNFWASWCPNCVAEMPDFERVHKSLGGRVEFLGVNQRDARGLAEDLAHETGVTYRLAEDPSGSVFDAFGGIGMPTTAFIDADGTVVEVVTGQLTEEQLRDFIARSFGVEN